MVRMFALSAVDPWFEPQSHQIKDDKTGTCICCFTAKHAAWTRKSKDWLVQYTANIIIISSNVTWYSWKIALKQQ